MTQDKALPRGHPKSKCSLADPDQRIQANRRELLAVHRHVEPRQFSVHTAVERLGTLASARPAPVA